MLWGQERHPSSTILGEGDLAREVIFELALGEGGRSVFLIKWEGEQQSKGTWFLRRVRSF